MQKGLMDFLQSASNEAAGTLSAPVDGIAWLLRKAGIPVPEDALGSSDWMARKGLTKEVPQNAASLAGATAGLLSPVAAAAKAPQIARGLLAAGDNLAAPATMSRGPMGAQRGAVDMKAGSVVPGQVATDSGPAVDQFPHENARKAWELGQRHRAMLNGERAGIEFYENLSKDDLDFVSALQERMPVSNAFYESAVRGAKIPVAATGARYGAIPTGGRSRNHLDQRDELGVSMAKVDGVDYQWAAMAPQFKKGTFNGLLLDPDKFRGSDGEPLMVGLKKLEKRVKPASPRPKKTP